MTRRSTLPGRAAGAGPPQAAGPAAITGSLVPAARRARLAFWRWRSSLAAVSVGAAACGSSGDDQVTLHVLAASSLNEAFTKIGADFEAAHPDVKVVFDFAGSQDLVAQIGQGAPADVVATADTSTMGEAERPVGRPADVRRPTSWPSSSPPRTRGASPGSTRSPTPRSRSCSPRPEVPAGKYAQQVLARAGVTVKPVSLEESVKGVVTKIALGEADAGIVYVTDVRAAGSEVDGHEHPRGGRT